MPVNCGRVLTCTVVVFFVFTVVLVPLFLYRCSCTIVFTGAERAFRALQHQVHAARARAAVARTPNPIIDDRADYASRASQKANDDVERVRRAMLSFLQLEGGGCSAQKTREQCESMLALWDATNGADGNVCSFCTLPRMFGGPKYECKSCFFCAFVVCTLSIIFTHTRLTTNAYGGVVCRYGMQFSLRTIEKKLGMHYRLRYVSGQKTGGTKTATRTERRGTTLEFL